METVKKGLQIGGAVIIALFMVGFVGAIFDEFNNDEPSYEYSSYNEPSIDFDEINPNLPEVYRNEFMASCVAGDPSMESYCSCMYRELTSNYTPNEIIAMADDENEMFEVMLDLMPNCTHTFDMQVR